MTLQIQAGGAVDQVIQSALMQLQRKYNVHQVSLYQGQQMVLAVGETVGHEQLPDTWQAEKIQSESGEAWLFPIMVRRQGWGWLVSYWRGNVNPEIEPEWELFTAHLGLIIPATGWGENHTLNHNFSHTSNHFPLPITEDEPYHFLLNALPVGVALTDAAGCCIYVNEYLTQQLCQMSAQEMLGQGWVDVIDPDDRYRVIHAWEQAVHTPPHEYAEEYRLQRRDGSMVWIRDNALVLRNHTGDVVGFICISVDITKKVKLKQELQESREQFLTLLENMPGMVYRYHPATAEHPHRFSYLSDCAEDIFELTVPEIMADVTAIWMKFTHPEDLDLLLTSIQTAIVQSAPWHCQWRITTPSGKLKWLEGRSQMRQHQNEPFWDGIVLDITEIKTAQAELEKQQEFLHRIVTATQSIIYVYDLEENRNVFVNPEIESVLGYSVAEIQAMGSQLFPNLIHPEDLPKIEANLAHLFEPSFAGEIQAGGIQIEYRMRTKSGEWRWLFSRDRVLSRNAQGLPNQMLGVATDITELKATELALAESQKFLDNLVTNLPVTVWRYQLWPDGREALLYVSAGCEALYGVPPEQARQNVQMMWDLTVPEDLPHILRLSEESRQHLTTWQAEWRIITPQGQHKWLRGRGQPERQPDGSTIWDSVFTDITPEKEAELRLQRFNQELAQRIQERTVQLQQQAQSEGLLRVIIETIHESLDIEKTLGIVLDETRSTLACDRVVVYQFNDDWTGYFLAESVAAGWVPVVTGALTTLSDHCLQETQGGRFHQHYILVSNDIYKSGFTPCHIELLERFQARAQVTIPIFLEQKLWGLLAAYQNDSPRIWQTNEIEILQHVGLHLAIALRQAELYKAAQVQVVELQKLNQLKDEFLSTVSHELRSPMHNIGMAIKMLELRLQRAGVLDSPELGIERYLDILKSATTRETELINDLLDLARLNAEQVDLELEPVDIEQILDHLLPPIQERTQSQNQHFHLQLPDQLYPLQTHANSLERILQELLHNACKYTPAQENITLAIEWETGNYCNFCVINTGVEIPLEEQERVFDNFYRIPTHDPWQHGGTGLGLALVKKLVERLQGQIHLTSGNNSTEFRVRLPI